MAHLDGELAKEREGGAVSAKVIRLSDQEMDDLKELWAAMCQNSPDLRFIVRKDIRPESEGSMGQKCNRCFEKICLDEIFSRRCNRFPSVMPTGFHCPGIDQFSDRINNSSASKARRSTMELLMLHNMIHQESYRLTVKFIVYSRWRTGIRPEFFDKTGKEKTRDEVRACLVDFCGEEAIGKLDAKLGARI